MISRFVKYSYLDSSLAKAGNIKRTRKSITFDYPCDSTAKCTPVSIILNRGVYKLECWGAKGNYWSVPDIGASIPGLGAYTSGEIVIYKTTQFFIYIVTTGYFNCYKGTSLSNGIIGGGATDVRLVSSENWYDNESLISRIMVAAGGAGAEWANNIGGNGGELIGGSGLYGANECKGSSQTSGNGSCKSFPNSIPYPGSFGSAGVPAQSNDYGGIGGGGYYGGTSYNYSYVGSGGSSFISGHKGCDAVLNSSSTIIHSGYNIHYSNLVFFNTKMIGGNKTMPLPTGNEGIWDSSKGSFRITMFNFLGSCKYSKSRINYLFVSVFISIK